MRACEIEGCGKPHNARGWCSAHYGRWRKHGDPLHRERYATPEEAFEARTMPVTETGCLLWFGATGKDGYGVIKVGGKSRRVHRWVYEQECGPIPDNMKIDHRCFVPVCVNAGHLREATNSQNLANRSGQNKGNSTGFRGVVKVVGKDVWVGKVRKDGEDYYLGRFDTPEEASVASQEKMKELFGGFAGEGWA